MTRRSSVALCSAAALSLALSAALCAPTTASADYAGFSDVGRRDWYVTDGYLDYALEEGLLKGYGDTFGPGRAVIRGDVAMVLWRVAGEPEAGDSGFTDVPSDSYYATAIAWAREKGIVTGYSATEFQPERAVSREELATMLHRYATNVARIDASSDCSALDAIDGAREVNEYAREAMGWAVDEGVLTGKVVSGSVRLEPKGTAVRAEMAKMASVFHAEVLDRGEIVPNPAPTVGRYGSYLEKVRELEGVYGTGGTRSVTRGTWRGKWAYGLCYVGLVNFGDGVERMVTVTNVENGSRDYPSLLEAYEVTVWDYSEQSDEAVAIWRGSSSYGSGYSLDITTSPDGARRYIDRIVPVPNYTFIGLRGDGSFGVVHVVDSSYDSSVGDFVNLVDGNSVSIQEYWNVLGSMGELTLDRPANRVTYDLASAGSKVDERDPERTLEATRATIEELGRRA